VDGFDNGDGPMRKRLRKKLFRRDVSEIFDYHRVKQPTWKWISCYMHDDLEWIKKFVEIVSGERAVALDYVIYDEPLIYQVPRCLSYDIVTKFTLEPIAIGPITISGL
jgi:hypothetical protein